MNAEELLAACRDLGLTLHAADGHLRVSPREKLTDKLRTQLRDHKEAVIALLNPSSFENPRTAIKKLEKEIGIDRPPPSAIAFIDEGECAHSQTDTTAAIATLKRKQLTVATTRRRSSSSFCRRKKGTPVMSAGS